MARIDYLEVADRLNATLPNDDDKYAKLYVWQHRIDRKLYGVEMIVSGKHYDVAVDIPRREVIPNLHKAHELAVQRLAT
jgi:hypothetical protein